jgi:cell division protein FtsN
LVNKALNRPNLEKRWVSLGVNAFPEPRPERNEKPERPEKKDAPAPKASTPQAPQKAQPKTEAPKKEERSRPPREPDERTIEVKDDPAFAKVITALAQKSAKTGRIYAVMSLPADDRARALKAIGAVKGVSAKTEGEGIWRRVTLTPDTITPMPSKKQVMPDYDDEEE